MVDSRKPTLSLLRFSGDEEGNFPFNKLEGESSGAQSAALASRLKSPNRLHLYSAAIDFRSNRKHWKKLVTSP